MGLKATSTYIPRFSPAQYISAYIAPAIVAMIREFADLIVSEAKLLCPVDTGALQESIGSAITVTQNMVIAAIFAGVYYAAYLEFGTGIRGAAGPGSGPGPYNPSWPGISPRPYLRPALDFGRVLFLSGAIKL